MNSTNCMGLDWFELPVHCLINHTCVMLDMNAPIFGLAYKCNPAFTKRVPSSSLALAFSHLQTTHAIYFYLCLTFTFSILMILSLLKYVVYSYIFGALHWFGTNLHIYTIRSYYSIYA